MKNKYTKKLNLEKLKIAKLDDPNSIKGGMVYTVFLLQSDPPAECASIQTVKCLRR